MNEKRHTNRRGMVALLSLILGPAILFSGCDKPPETVKKPVSKVETKAPVKTVPAVETPAEQAEKVETKPAALTGEFPALYFHLPMDDNAEDPTVHDVASGQQHQTIVDQGGDPNTNAHSAVGAVGSALMFKGAHSNRILCSETLANNVLTANHDFTIAVWVYVNSEDTPSNLQYYMVKFTSGAGPYWGIRWGVYSNSNGYVYLDFSPSAKQIAAIIGPLSDDTWHHVVVSRLGQTVKVHKDGAQEYSGTDQAYAESLACVYDAKAGLQLGHGTPSILDDLRIYDRALSEEEIEALFNLGSRE